MVDVGLAFTLEVLVALKPVEGVHAYDNKPVLLEGIAEIVVEEPLQIVWSTIGLSWTLGVLTVTVTEFADVHPFPSVAVTV